MKQRDIFTKTRKEAPSDEVSESAKLLIRAGFINKEVAGVYDMLPLGLRVINKIKHIVRTEMNAVGGQELDLTALQDAELWKKTDRWSDDNVDVWFKTALKNGTELGLGFTHEEAITRLMTNHINSYKDLPAYPYQFQTKFRNELRAKSGIMRGREFLMKDLYSFSATQEQHDAFYEKMKEAYMNIFEKVGLGDRTYLTFSSGGTFSKYSHEFQTVCESGEDKIYYSKEKEIAVNEEVMNAEVLGDLALDKESLVEMKAVEVGNIFGLGTKFSEPIQLIIDTPDGKREPVIMGCYGIGIGRLMGVVAEIYSDEKGLVWPEAIAPFRYHIVNLLSDEQAAEQLYTDLQKAGLEVLLDNRDLQAGAKLADSDLIGIPYQIIIGKTFIETGNVELINRKTGESEQISPKELLKKHG
jgi:prolyl-tRNA synthetase